MNVYPHELPPVPPVTQPVHVLFDVGYLALKDPALLLAAVRGFHARLVDCRFSPRSRLPGFRQAFLTQALGEQYVLIPELGNKHYKNGEPIEIVDLARGLETLFGYLQSSPVILMCACADRYVCHRLFITQAFEFQYGVRAVALTRVMAEGLQAAAEVMTAAEIAEDEV